MNRRLFAFALCALAACGAGTSLEGSLSDQVSLAFDQVQLQRSATAIAVSYLKALPQGGGNDTVFKVVASTSGLDLSHGLVIALTDQLNGGPALRGAVARVVSGESTTEFPPLVRGSLTFDGPPTVGAHVSGSFTVTFGQGGSIGAGRTVFGDFSGTVAQAGQ